ncbi:MAG: 2-hydroxyglutaryl-CoA dehydratase [Desulfobacterales bacterium]|nr:2-hydroxyglutaryl-CoA dehydratase [Desulfobacterales bacterium]
MWVAGCDVGSLTAKAVILEDKKIIAGEWIRVASNPVISAQKVIQQALSKARLSMDSIVCCCTTGYGRTEIPFASLNMSEISCHGMGAFFLDKQIRTVIDMGGQDCKVIALDDHGYVSQFSMNDKCAAGTGRSLEMLSDSLGIEFEQLGEISLKSRHPVPLTNKCTIYMELEVMSYVYEKKKLKDIAAGITLALARRVAQLASSIPLNTQIAFTGGVSKNTAVVKHLESLLDISFTKLPFDPQLIGALGAAVFALANTQG